MMPRRAFALVEILVVAMILLILAAIAIPNFEEARNRRRVAQSLNELAVLGAAIEAYHVDHNTFPAMAQMTSSLTAAVVPAPGSAAGTSRTADWGPLNATGFTVFPNPGRTFRTPGAPTGTAQRFIQLTTPVAYIAAYPVDPFADVRGMTFRYHHDANGWIIGSYGPDEDMEQGGDLPWNATFSPSPAPANPSINSMEFAYRSNIAQPSVTLLTHASMFGGKAAFTFDPTNGSSSQGDIYRIR